MLNLDKIFNSLYKVDSDLREAANLIEDIKNMTNEGSGQIKKVLPQHLNALQKAIKDLVEGNQPYNVSQIEEYLDTIPVAEIRSNDDIFENKDTDNSTTPTGEEDYDNSDVSLKPDTTNGPKGAIGNASNIKEAQKILNKYLKDELRESETPTTDNNDDERYLSFNKIKKDIMNESQSNFNPDKDILSTDITKNWMPKQLDEDLEYTHQLQASDNIKESLEQNGMMQRIRESNDNFVGLLKAGNVNGAVRLREFDTSKPVGDWKDVVREANTDEFGVDSILNAGPLSEF